MRQSDDIVAATAVVPPPATVAQAEHRTASIARDAGLTLEIIGWVALWQPAELLLSEWVPIYRRLRTTQRIADAGFACN
jgi:hypothetical protein